MGNATSCTPYAVPTGSIKVIDSNGGVEEYMHTVRAAELMVENPGQFVCDSNYLKVGYRIPGLVADEELEPHRLYFLLPMDMLYSVLAEEEVASLSCKASKAMRKRGRSKNIGRRILPVLSEFCLFPTEDKPVAERTRSVNKMCGRMSKERSWTPALDTIEEVP
ncbi:uncharacterized protein LOC103722870 [Phoenix dactylifera]|uniref:Uncharacterized protein LOC103722870 n=1 Tax=Phoenix dactylifera TaxID=42345 RepID=A0A8B7D2L9_PHODC|nr:uncharacterized protein LOC103722870 [Phoenix dactylifera]